MKRIEKIVSPTKIFRERTNFESSKKTGTMTESPKHWPIEEGYLSPQARYDPHSEKFIAVFRHETSPSIISHVFVRSKSEPRYRPVYSLDKRRAQDQLLVDCGSPSAAFLELRVREDGSGASPIAVSKFDLSDEQVVERLEVNSLEAPDACEAISYINNLTGLCTGGDVLRFSAAVEPGTRNDNQDYEFWACQLRWDSARIELLAEMGGPFC